ncbi:hypothetical protein [Aquimarina sediminis]|uniref:hypothetical protein n=1 Tax=Aquimarina sediminis TaxID=2070536 RepID=UPI000CA01364|nr:hypothetical protein [Aquimarina sediminis]
MSTNKIQLNIDLDHFANQLQYLIFSDLMTVDIVYKKTSEPNFSSQEYFLEKGFVKIELPKTPINVIRNREINKCFKSIMGEFQNYMDNLITCLKLKSTELHLEPPISDESVNIFLKEKFQEVLLDVSTDRSLNVPKKLNLLLDENVLYKEVVQSFFNIRNGFEHHKSKSKKHNKICYKRLGFASTSGYEVTQPGPLGVNEGLVIRVFNEELIYDQGSLIVITKDQLNDIAFNFVHFIIPYFQKTIKEEFQKT